LTVIEARVLPVRSHVTITGVPVLPAMLCASPFFLEFEYMCAVKLSSITEIVDIQNLDEKIQTQTLMLELVTDPSSVQ
jgi:hypothetical protein